MSAHPVEISEIVDVQPHPNADRLELATVRGWQCVVQKGAFRPGDRCVYIPIDSVLDPLLEAKIFGADSKVKLSNHRVKTIKLRGAISQGLVVDLPSLELDGLRVGTDVAAQLGVSKYEPPEAPASMRTSTGATSRKQTNPHFRKYTSLENAKNHPNVFEPGETVVVTEKIHGTNFRAGYVPFHADTLWKRFKSFVGLAPKWDFVYGSHNVQLQSKLLADTHYDSNVYAEAVKKYRLRDLLQPGEVVYGEVYGDGIQKGYTYGCGPGERKLALFDTMVDGKYLDPLAFREWAQARDLPVVPTLLKGPFDLAAVKALTAGASVLAPSQRVREGVVVKPLKDTVTHIGRKVLKFISDEYLLRDQTDFH
jgi:RNA ligase (TIGR02306 family)